MRKPEYKDISSLPEDDRIRMIGQHAMERPGQQIGFCTDATPFKFERYIQKLQKMFPELRVLSATPGPIEGVVTVVITRGKGQ